MDIFLKAVDHTTLKNTIYVSNLPYTVTKKVLIQVFSKYGEVKNVGIAKGKAAGVRPYATALITFPSFQSALKSYHRRLILRGRNISIRPAEKRQFQLFQRMVKKYNRPGMLDYLNDDCLMHLFSFMPAADLVRTENVNSRWCEMANLHLKKSLSFDFRVCEEDNFPHKYTDDFVVALIHTFSSTVRNLTVYYSPNLNVNILNLINACKELREVKIIGFDFKRGPKRYNWYNNIETVTFENCIIPDIYLLNLNPDVESITFKSCKFVTGRFLRTCPPYKQVSACNCQHFQRKYFDYLSRNVLCLYSPHEPHESNKCLNLQF